MRLAIYHLPSSYDPQSLDIGSSCYRRAYAETPSTSVGSHVTQWACSKEKQRHDSEGERSLDSQCLQKLGNIFILLTLHLDSHVTFVHLRTCLGTLGQKCKHLTQRTKFLRTRYTTEYLSFIKTLILVPPSLLVLCPKLGSTC